MPYTIPSVLVYQQLANAGGVANVTPDLPGVIVGPLYNVIPFNSNSESALSKSIAGSFNYLDGDTGATAAPATLDVTLPSMEPGQQMSADDVSELKVWLYDATVATHVEDTLSISGDVSNGGVDITLGTNPASLTAGGEPIAQVGDRVYLEGDSGGETLVSVITAINGSVISIADVVTLALSGSSTFDLHVHRDYTAIQATAGVDTSTTAADDVVTLTMPLTVPNGTVDKAQVHIDYRALRTDLGGRVLEISDITDALARLGDLTDRNPAGLGVKLALANTTTGVRLVTVDSDDLTGYQGALELLEGSDNAYALAPMTQDVAVLAAFSTHAAQMSTPQQAGWRIALVNHEIPEDLDIAEYGSVDIANVDGENLLQSGSARFLEDGIRAGDVVTVAGTDEYIVDSVLNNNQIAFVAPGPASTANGVTAVVTRTLTKSERADLVADISESYNSNRVAHVQPDLVGVQIDGATKFVPGYYLAAGLAGAIAGFPVQQGLTNIVLAGYTDLDHSNFYFTREQMNRMAEKGTMLFAQVTQDSAPYCRHELMTDMSTLQYRELLKVKNLDYLSYYFRDKLAPFIGTWNITEDTLNVMRQTIIASAELLKGQRLPKIGAPLVGFQLKRLEQDQNNKDQVIIELEVATADPNNYTNLYLIV